MCPYYLDGDLGEAFRLRPVIPVSLATVQFSRSEKRRAHTANARGPRSTSAGGEAGLSKLNSMRAASPGREAQTRSLPGPVDMLELTARGGRCP